MAVPNAIDRCGTLLANDVSDQIGRANVVVFLGGLVAQQGDFDRARALIGSARDTYDDLGQRAQALNYCATVLGGVELLAQNAGAAEAVLRELCDELERTDDLSHLASRSSDLAEAILRQDKVDEAEEWTLIAERHAAVDDLDAQMMWRPVRARIYARRGNFESAEALAVEGVMLAESSDGLNRCANAHRDLGEVLRLAGHPREAAAAFQRAISLFEKKGNVVEVARVRALEDDLAFV